MKTANRRLLLSIPALLLGASTLLVIGPAIATEQSQDRQDARDIKQDTRSESREAKVDCRQADQQSNPECRQDKRDAKQDGRESARDTQY